MTNLRMEDFFDPTSYPTIEPSKPAESHNYGLKLEEIALIAMVGAVVIYSVARYIYSPGACFAGEDDEYGVLPTES